MESRSPDETTTAFGRATSTLEQKLDRDSVDQRQPSPLVRVSEDRGDDTSFVARRDEVFTPIASAGREKDPRDDTGKSMKANASTSPGGTIEERLQSNLIGGGDATKPTISLSDDVESAPGPHPAIVNKSQKTVEPILDCGDDAPRPGVYYIDGEDDAREKFEERLQIKLKSEGDATKPTISLSDDVESAPGPQPAILDKSQKTVEPILDCGDDAPRPAEYYVDGEDDAREKFEERLQIKLKSEGDATKLTISLSDDVESAPGPHPANLDGSLQKTPTTTNKSTVEPILCSDDSPRPAEYYVDGDDARERKLEQGTGTPRPSESTPGQTGNQHFMAQSDPSLMEEDRLTKENESFGSESVGSFEEPVVVAPIDADLEDGDYLVEAYKVPDEPVYEATPTQPWFKQRRTKLMIAAILALLAVLAVSLSVAFTREPVLQTNEPTFSPAPSASSTSLPSISSAPSLSCESKVLATKKQFDLLQKPEDIKDAKVSIDGVDAAVVWHDGKLRAKLYVYFFQLSERRRDWDQTAFFQEDLTTALGKDDFDVSMSGNVAVVGVFPQNRTITYRRRGNNWEESTRMNLPDMTSFSFRDGLLVVTAGVCNFVSCMSSASFFEQSDDDWLIIDEMTIDDGDYFDALIDGELVVLRYRTGVREDDCTSSFYKLIEEEIVMQDQRPIEGCGQMVMGEGLLAHAVDGGVAMHQEHGSVFVVNHSGEATDSELELSLHKNVLAVGGLRGDKIKVFSNGTGDNAMNWTEVLELDLFNAGLLHDSFDVFGGFLSVIEGHDLFTFDLSRCTPARTVVPAEEEIAEGSTECYPVNIWCVGEDWTASVKSADGESVGKTLRPDVPSYNKHLEQLCLFEGQYKFQLQMKLTTREYKVRLNVPKRDSSLGRVLLRSGLTGDEILESTLWVPFDLDSPENRLPTNFPSFGSTPTVGTGGTLSPTVNVIRRTDPPTTFSPTVSDRPSLSNEPTLAPSASTRPSDSKKPSTPPSMSLTPTATPSDLPSRSPSDMPTSRPSEEPRYCIIISIVYDYFPAETSWELISDEDGAIVHEYQETDDTETSRFDWFCLTEGRYTFKIFDELGDGIRSEDNGQGSYAIASDDYGWSDGIILAQGGEFADVDVANFVLPYVMPSIAPSSSKIPTASPTFMPSLSPSSSKTPTASPTVMPSLSPSSSLPPSSSVSPSCGGSIIMIQIQYDLFPGETSFDLKKIVSEEGQETGLASYHSGSAGDKDYDESICLGDGLYHFSLYDSYGDGFNGEYSLKLMPGETIIMRDNRVSLYGEQVLFRLPFDRETLDVRTIGSNGRLFTPPTPSPTVGTPVPNAPFPTEGTPVPNTPFPTEGTPSPTVSHRPSVSHSPSMAPSSTAGPSVSISPSCGGSLMMIKIQYDRYPDETSYELEKIASEDGQETEVASHSGSVGDENREETICLDDGLYSFSFYDSYCDGFRGEYSLTLVTGEIIIMRDDGVSKCREQVKFRLPFDGDTLDVVPIGSDTYVPPTANPDSASVSSGGYVFIAVLGNDVPAGQLYVSSITRQATNGYCSVSLDLVDVVYSPYSGFIGTDTCVYEACDTQGLCDDATVTVTTRFLTR